MDRKKRKKPSVSRIYKLIGAAGVLALTIGTVGLFAFSGDSIQTSETESSAVETTASQVQTSEVTTTSEAEQTVTTSGLIKWHKAGIDEYEISDSQQTTTTTTTTTAAPASQTERSSQPQTSQTAEQTTSASTAQQTVTTTTPPQTTTTTTTPPAVTTTTTTTPVVTTTTPAVTTTKAVTTTRPVTTTKKVTTTKAPTVRTVYNSPKIKSYTQEEFDMLCYVVQAEAGYCAEKYKIAVANVVLNRVKSPRFANNIKAVLTARNQFTAISNYYTKRNKPNASTINCCKRALNGEDNTNGAVYYYSPRYVGGSVAAWFESMKLCVAWDSARFFKPW